MSKLELSRRRVLAALAAMEFLRSAVAEAQTSLSQSGLVGDIQGPTMITDPAKWPKKFAEAPMLAELVKAGKLPPVEQRVPAEPLVWQPLNEIGKYGGTWRRAFTGPADGENGNRICRPTSRCTGAPTAARSCPAWPRARNSATTARPTRCSCARA